ncbi:MAG: tetraacyldisaccharide 4'-kinase [Burkholderiales bacterium]|nr:tetraacyldisaccharide 4'-kinase [Flavobacterium sp.]
MILLRKILFPFAILYGWITQIRNFLYDTGLLKSYTFDLPIIAVGNLSVGGTGKTPQIEYLIRLLSNQYKVATLSRGYKRQSRGFVLAHKQSDALTLGDEPFQFYQKFPNIQVAVDANRKNGIAQLLLQNERPQIILLDDAFQHRRVKAGFYILLTAYGDLYCDDWMLPTGNLRENRRGSKRADLIVVTKCPKSISEAEQQKIKMRLGTNQPIFFSSIDYDESVYSQSTTIKVSEIRTTAKVLLAGIAKPQTFFNHLKSENDITMTFSDHHSFTPMEIEAIKSQTGNRFIITTEKDYMRLNGRLPASQLYYLPIKTSFITQRKNFDQAILAFVETYQTDFKN